MRIDLGALALASEFGQHLRYYLVKGLPEDLIVDAPESGDEV